MVEINTNTILIAIAIFLGLFGLIAGIQSDKILAHSSMSRENNIDFSVNNITRILGDNDGGFINNTYDIDQIYYITGEIGGASPAFNIQMNFSNITRTPAKITLVGRYEGNPSHNVKIRIYNCSSNTSEDITINTNDFPSSSTDSRFQFLIDGDTTNYLCGNTVSISIVHDTVGNLNHAFYIDYIELETKSLLIKNANNYTKIIDYSGEYITDNILLNTNTGQFQILEDGLYYVSYHISFTGSASNIFNYAIFKNEIELSEVRTTRHINSNGDVGSLSASNHLRLNKGDILDLRVKSDTNNAYIGLESAIFSICLIHDT